MMESYKELEVWQKAIVLATDVYKLTASFPREERYGLTSQVQRSGVSVPANIAEGWGRGSTGDYLKHLRISRGSLAELETHLIIAHNLNYVQKKDIEIILKKIEGIGKMINSLIKSLKRE